jgi:hypothetical protein
MRHLWDDKARELREAVARAHVAYTRAAEKSNEVLKDVPSGLPHSAEMRRITDAANAERHALEQYTEALRAFNDYANQKTPQTTDNQDSEHSL